MRLHVVRAGQGSPPILFIHGLGNSTSTWARCMELLGPTHEVIALDLAGICVSAGAACSSGKVGRSHVLDAMGLGADAGCAIRVSLPWNATMDVVEPFVAAWAAMRGRLSRRAA